MTKVRRSRRIPLDKVCRLCLCAKRKMRDIIDSKILNMISICSTIEIDSDDELPKQICLQCFCQLTKFCTFRRKIERNDRLLSKIAKRMVKKESAESTDILLKAVNEAEIETSSVKSHPDDDETQEDPDFKEIVLDYDVELRDEELVYTEGPPPLIPLMPVKKIEDVHKHDAVKDLPQNAPPLIPIVPIPNIQTENLVEVQLQLECSVCSAEFNNVVDLREHRLSQCKGTGLVCNICKKEFTERKTLIGHLKRHVESKNFTCKICKKGFCSNSAFKIHMRTHTGERPFSCQICGKRFVRWAGVLTHMKTHDTIKPYQCTTCGKLFKVASNLERHKILHSKSMPYCCSYCGKTFNQSDSLLLHIRSYHTLEKPFLCNECGKGFVSSARLNRHMMIHTGYKPHQCTKCTKSYSNSNDLKNHMLTHSGGPKDSDKPHVCSVCSARFFHACRLVKHMKVHEKKKCPHCFRIYSLQSLLDRHIEAKHPNEGTPTIISGDVEEDTNDDY